MSNERKDTISEIIIAVLASVFILFMVATNAHADESKPIECYRFVQISSSGLPSTRVYVDTTTGVEYCTNSHGQMTPLVNKDGKPLIYNPETGE